MLYRAKIMVFDVVLFKQKYIGGKVQCVLMLWRNFKDRLVTPFDVACAEKFLKSYELLIS